jgi:PAS domain S-box-containing protein
MKTPKAMPSKMGSYLRDGSPIKDGTGPRFEQGSWIFDAEKNDLIAILDNLPTGIAILGSPFGNALYINRQLIATLGYSLQDTPSTRAMLKKAMPDLKARREAVRLWKQIVKSGGGSGVYQDLCADGTVRTFEQRAVVLRKDLIVNMWIDVTRREAAEAQLRESEWRFRSFFEKSTDPFLLLDGNRVINCNLAALQVFNRRNKEQIIGATIEDLSPEKQPDGCLSSKKVRTLLGVALKQGNHRFEWTVRRSNGKEIPVEVSIATITLGGERLLFVVLRDITLWKKAQNVLLHAKADLENQVRKRTSDLTEMNRRLLAEIQRRKKTEQEMRRSREELRYLSEHLQQMREEDRAYVAREVHDQLGQSLSALTIDLACLKEKVPQEDGGLREQVQAIERQVSGTMQSIREICRELRPPVFDDFGLLTAIKWHLREFEKRTGIKCVAIMDEKIPTLEKGLALVILRTYQEAMTNILRHAEATKVQVTLRTHAKNLVLRVKDNGKGIRRQQIEAPLSLGILGIRERVRFWGGNSFFTGSPGKGTTMTVSIPIARRKVLLRHRKIREVSDTITGNEQETL